MTAEYLIPSNCRLAEGPVYDDRFGRLYWVDIPSGAIYCHDFADETTTMQKVGGFASVVIPTNEGSELIIALQNEVVRYNPETGERKLLCAPEYGKPNNRFNDGKCDALGRLWLGSMQLDYAEADGSLYVIEQGSRSKKLLGQLHISNGIAWNRDNTEMYFIDSLSHTVAAFDFDLTSATLTNKRVLCYVDKQLGVPDGMTIDEEDCLWVALYGGGKVVRIDSRAGEIIDTIKVHEDNVTSCTFGGPDKNLLFITTARCDHKPSQGGNIHVAVTTTKGTNTNFFKT